MPCDWESKLPLLTGREMENEGKSQMIPKIDFKIDIRDMLWFVLKGKGIIVKDWTGVYGQHEFSILQRTLEDSPSRFQHLICSMAFLQPCPML